MFFKKKQTHIQTELDMNNIPRHIAFIMDGNGRWAKSKGMPRTFGHHEGIKNIRTLAIECNKLGVKAMTVYTFSTENWKRPKDEVEYIFRLPSEFFQSYMKDFMENNIQVRYIGHLEDVPSYCKDVIFDACEQTKNNTGLILCFAFNYGSNIEIIEACRDMAIDYKNGDLEIEDFNPTMFDNYLMTADLPQLDFMVRTSGEYRISNFLLWQIAYAELAFVDRMWPEFSIDDLYSVLLDYQSRNRRFGGLKK